MLSQLQQVCNLVRAKGHFFADSQSELEIPSLATSPTPPSPLQLGDPRVGGATGHHDIRTLISVVVTWPGAMGNGSDVKYIKDRFAFEA